MSSVSKKTKKRLKENIKNVANNTEKFAKNPQRDFSRNRKLTFATTLEIVLAMEGQSLSTELLKYFKFRGDVATSSAFIQARDKIKLEAFASIFQNFTSGPKNIIKYRDYRLLAHDGSDINLPLDQTNKETYQPLKNEGVNLLHLTVFYDIMNKIYVDASLEGKCKSNERNSLCKMLDHTIFQDKSIIIADRGYESYNVFAHISEKGQKYIIRVKDVNSTGILKNLDLPKTSVFDTEIERILTRRQTKELLKNPKFKFLPSNSTFDFLPLKSKEFYPLCFRIVCFEIAENSYETLITNLDSTEFSIEELKKIYHMRWGIETSFRELKYALGLVNLHAKKLEFIKQEIYAKLIMYNFCMMITKQVVVQKRDAKWGYQVNFTRAIEICRYFFGFSGVSPPEVESLIANFTLPIRENRTYKRNLKNKSFVRFLYRVA